MNAVNSRASAKICGQKPGQKNTGCWPFLGGSPKPRQDDDQQLRYYCSSTASQAPLRSPKRVKRLLMICERMPPPKPPLTAVFRAWPDLPLSTLLVLSSSLAMTVPTAPLDHTEPNSFVFAGEFLYWEITTLCGTGHESHRVVHVSYKRGSTIDL